MSHLRLTGSALRTALLAASLATSLRGASSNAQPQGDRLPPGDRQPPPFAYTACDGHAEGASCEVNLGDRAITGTCAPDGSQRMFCRPTHMPPPPQREG